MGNLNNVNSFSTYTSEVFGDNNFVIEPTNLNFTVTDYRSMNTIGSSYVAYLFAHDQSADGKMQCDSYVGTGLASGNKVSLGWEPQYLILKNTTRGGDNWVIFDTMRGISTDQDDSILTANTTVAEYASLQISVNADGFELTNTDPITNSSGDNFVYCAVRAPQKTPLNSSEVFDVAVANGQQPVFETGFPVDLGISTNRASSTSGMRFATRLTSQNNGKYLDSSSSAAEATNAEYGVFDSNDSWHGVSGFSNSDFYSWNFKRAPGFFDVVAYEGNGVAGNTVQHNLGVTPEMIIVKGRTSTSHWGVYHKDLGPDAPILINSNAAAQSYNGYWNSTTPTGASFTIGDHNSVNNSSQQYLSYLFATVNDVSKVGSYTGTAADLDIDAGFTNGAAFVLIKRTDATGDWYLWDSTRGITTGNDPYLLLNSTAAEVTSTDYIDPLDA